MKKTNPNTHQKAFELNMDPALYGTIAEIGAGQEVARWFFRVGGASGTVAKTMSAYDMKFSDSIYGEAEQYVSRERLREMLGVEYDLIVERLDEERGESSKFFCYAATVATRSFSRQTDGHGWIGVRMQQNPRTPSSDILVHVRLFDEDNLQQQEALGTLGINLLWACSKFGDDYSKVIDSLMNGLTRNRTEIDVVLFDGPDYSNLDNRLINLSLVEKQLTSAVIFSPQGTVQHASELLYKRPVILERGKFAPVTNVNEEMIETARAAFAKNLELEESEILEIMEITMNNLLGSGGIDHDDFLARLDILTGLGKTVMISEYGEFFRLAGYLNRYTHAPVGFVLGVALLREIVDQKYYTDLPGGILESFGRLFKSNVRMFAFPALDEETGELLTADNLKVADHLKHLYLHLRENEVILPLETENPKPLSLTSAYLADTIRSGDESWKTRVTPFVAQKIEANGYWGCR
ncbi:TonB-dependent receptor [Opitutia bacterium ISCC 51]|nr:TonB-dependent receptor [Opitutae bacterium ISCC 51]QXD28804.1 TonB-dependent receptor [Opitutae bacterium ISCC 52]